MGYKKKKHHLKGIFHHEKKREVNFHGRLFSYRGATTSRKGEERNFLEKSRAGNPRQRLFFIFSEGRAAFALEGKEKGPRAGDNVAEKLLRLYA